MKKDGKLMGVDPLLFDGSIYIFNRRTYVVGHKVEWHSEKFSVVYV